MVNSRQSRSFLLLGGAIMVLSGVTACQTTTAQQSPSAASRGDRINSVLERAADNAEVRGNKQENLKLLERVYQRNPGDKDAALKYGRALREADHVAQAARIIEPLARDENDQNADAKIEYSSIQAALGNYAGSEEFARQAVLLEPDNGQAYHLLGIALDAQGHHKQAETAFRKGLDNWDGDPGPILNNLGLNLASQGFLDEAIETLRKAKAASPGRMEIERNLRIVSALQVQPSSAGWDVPPPAPKPDHKPVIDGGSE
ncbi:MAG: tetratricopeptide repeat protein [Rhodospirillales bacterium]|nr:tetratricopeptide repeat protein [Rhodospirillales bacterium]